MSPKKNVFTSKKQSLSPDGKNVNKTQKGPRLNLPLFPPPTYQLINDYKRFDMNIKTARIRSRQNPLDNSKKTTKDSKVTT